MSHEWNGDELAYNDPAGRFTREEVEIDFADFVEVPLLDVGGYLACGCHGSQREHTCGPLD